MRQAGVLAAAGLVALESGPKRLHIDHDNARLLARQLATIPGITLDPEKVQTNIVIFSLEGSGIQSADFITELRKRNILVLPVDDIRVRMVTHLELDRAAIDRAIEAVSEIMRKHEHAR